jgi:hypothetical protein
MPDTSYWQSAGHNIKYSATAISALGHSMSSEPMKKPSHLRFYSYLVNLKYHGRYEKLQMFIIVYVVVFHL